MELSKPTLNKLKLSPDTKVPSADLLALPERVIQFGTGVLLRGLIDYFIDNANRQGIFNGRIVVVKSTAQGGADEFNRQHGLFTHVIKGLDKGEKVDQTMINSSISRVLSAGQDWQAILNCARNPEIQLIVSNTTEVGITLTEDDIQASPPHSFPGKLLALLYARFRAGMEGFVVVPTELIPDNGKKLKAIVLDLAAHNKLGEDFARWIDTANHFCSSLVDRIVPGKLAAEDRNFDYQDELAIMSEPYALWAIEASHQKAHEVLSFAKANSGVVIAPDITKYRELKLRMLNGTHTMSCGLAVLAGVGTVKEGMDDPALSSFIEGYMLKEVAPAISGDAISLDEARRYGAAVLDRFRNPFIRHKWISITLQYSSKMKMRNLPILMKHYERNGTPPPFFALGFAAFLLFMKSEKKEDGLYYGATASGQYQIQDDNAALFSELWQKYAPEELVSKVLGKEELWGADLRKFKGFEAMVTENLFVISSKGVKAGVEAVL